MKNERQGFIDLSLSGMRLLVVYLMLYNGQTVNYNKVYDMFEISYPTFARIIGTIRDSVENNDLAVKSKLIYNRRKDTYELIKI